MKLPCPACEILFEGVDACPICGREPPRSTRDPGPDGADGGGA